MTFLAAVGLALSGLTSPLAAQVSPQDLVGSYQGHQTEVGAALRLSEDGRFDYYMVYGALDEIGTGTWTADEEGIFLDSDPVTAPAFDLVDSKRGKGPGFELVLDVPQGMSVQYLSALVFYSDGSERRENFEQARLRFRPPQGASVVAVALLYPTYLIASDKIEVPPKTAAMRFRFEPNDLGRVDFDHQLLRRDGDAFLLDRYDRTLRFTKAPPPPDPLGEVLGTWTYGYEDCDPDSDLPSRTDLPGTSFTLSDDHTYRLTGPNIDKSGTYNVAPLDEDWVQVSLEGWMNFLINYDRLDSWDDAPVPTQCTQVYERKFEPKPFVLQLGHIELEKGPDGNTVILDAPDGLVVVDTGRHAEHSQAILDYAQSAERPVAAIVNSHWHLDHTTGNVDLLAAFPYAELVATDAALGALGGFLADAPENARKRIADPALSPEEHKRAERSLAILSDRGALVAAYPVTESGPREIAGRTIDVRVARAAATEADLWLLVPEEQLAIVGDLVVAQSPFFDTGCEEGWAAALDDIAAAQWTTLVPGHGAPMDRAGFERWHIAFTRFVDCAHSDASAEDCAAGWERDAAGFFSAAEAPSVRDLSLYYIDLLRQPSDKRMAYCGTR